MAINPYREVFTLESRFKPLFRGFDQGAALTAGFVPAVDIYEDAEKVVLKLEVPGVDEKDLDVRVEKNTLTVKGKRNFDKEEKEENSIVSSAATAASIAPSPCPPAWTRRMSMPSTVPVCSSWSSRRKPKPSRSRLRSTLQRKRALVEFLGSAAANHRR